MAFFEGLKNLASAVALVCVPITVAWLGSHYTSATKEREVSAKFVELAVGILTKEPSKTEADAGIRRWATRVIDQHSGVPFDERTREDIVNRVPLPKVIDTPLTGGSRAVSGSRQIERVIVRDTQQDDLQKELQGLRSGQVAYHYLIAKDGTVHRLKEENEVAYHTSGFNEDSIGIGVLHVSGSEYTTQQVENLTTLISDIVRRHGVPKANIVAASELQSRSRSDFVKVKDRVLVALSTK